MTDVPDAPLRILVASGTGGPTSQVLTATRALGACAAAVGRRSARAANADRLWHRGAVDRVVDALLAATRTTSSGRPSAAGAADSVARR